jgi:hypothetical protein
MNGKILELQANDLGQITSARYLFSLTDGQNTVESEGNWFFDPQESGVPLGNVTEEMVVKWIVDATTKDGVNAIKSRLQAQLSSLSASKSVNLPWKPLTFTVTL